MMVRLGLGDTGEVGRPHLEFVRNRKGNGTAYRRTIFLASPFRRIEGETVRSVISGRGLLQQDY